MKILVTYKNAMAAGSYYRTRAPGDMSDHPEFTPFYTPQQMLAMGVFEGKYMNSCFDEFPKEWLETAVLCDEPNPKANYFKKKSRKSTTWWNERNLINMQDPRGWFEWYCRFWMGRRTPDDARQIKRQRMMVRHSAQVIKHGTALPTNRSKQRQTLLQWSWNAFPDRR